MKETWLSRQELEEKIITKIKPAYSVLDIGCGIRPQEYQLPVVHICCEPFAEYVDKLQEVVKKRNDRVFVVLKADWAEVLKVLPPKSVENIFITDVIEHITKKEAAGLIKKTEKIATGQIIIFTPLGYMPQHHEDGLDAWGLHGTEVQTHRSGWTPADFDKTWEIYGAKKFHFFDLLGRKFEKPFGAFYAIKNIENNSSEKINIDTLKIWQLLVEINVSAFTKMIVSALKLTVWIVSFIHMVRLRLGQMFSKTR